MLQRFERTIEIQKVPGCPPKVVCELKKHRLYTQCRCPKSLRMVPDVSTLLASLGYSGKRRVVLGYTLSTQTLMKTEEQKKLLSKFTILCWATFIAILGRMQPWTVGWTPLAIDHFGGELN